MSVTSHTKQNRGGLGSGSAGGEQRAHANRPLRISFFVPGIPQPKGSSKWVRSKSTGKSVPKTNERLSSWAGAVSQAACDAMDERPVTAGSLEARIVFKFNRPKSISARKRPRHNVTPDIDKLLRAVLDAMTGVVYRDDALIDRIEASKVYVETQAGVAVVLAERLEQQHGA